MKTLSWQARKKLRKHSNEMISLRKMMEEELETEEAVIKKLIAHPKGVMLWSNKTIDLFHDRCREDIVYVDATGSIVKKAKGKTSPFYVYEMVVRNPFKGSSPVPVATYITNDHTTASISFFLGAAKNYHLAMHVFGLMTQATTMSELDEVVTSAVVVFSSSHSDRNVGKHFENLQGLLTNSAQSNLDDSTIVEDCVVCDLGRHGTGTIYQKLSQKYNNAAKKPTQRWKQRKQNRRGVYVTPINKPFVFRQHKKNLMQNTKTAKAPAPLQKQVPGSKRQGKTRSIFIHIKMTEHAEDDAQGDHRVSFHIHAHKCELGTRIYILNHYTAGVILFGEREEVRRHTLSKIHFDSYGAIVSFVHYINAEESTVYLADPARNSAEQAESDNAAKKFRDYFKMRRTCCSKTDWVDIKWKGGVMKHPVQQDGNSCGVVVCMMAKEVMEVFPKTPTMAFGTTKKEMAHQRKVLAMEILTASVFDKEVNCAMCAGIKPPGSVPHHTHTDWIQCDSCFRWCHTQCLHMDQKSLEEAQVGDWVCSLCNK
ncbi:hypothetical protein F7725_015385 [Dissostichus mawsoni]|uniref:PHD-type domain-containing protein n=1 Tax=Dissostichus mawsoni TaxID=36200 RepID=A0A7J5YKR8_DISMA|nr:hypothetical protein F7725_015385 [Dissostichus mawsoni]